MTAPVLYKKKFWIVNPKAATNQIHNPTFAHPEFVTGWSGTNAAIAVTGAQQRRGAYSMKVTPVSGQLSRAAYDGLAVTAGLAYTFSCDVKGVAGQAMRIYIGAYTGTAFTATGYWQRIQVTTTIPSGATTTFVGVQRYSAASAEPFYVDGAQFEQASKASTFFDGYSPGCRWTGAIRNSPSERSANTGLGGELVDLEDYCHVVQAIGLGHGDWNQVLTKMTAGGDMYQTHIRKSRNFSIIVDFLGNSLSEIEANRAAVIDLLRPDKLSNLQVPEQFGINWGADYRGHEQRIIRYQGIAANGDEATNPVDIVCVPLSASMVDTPDLPTYQRAVLNFTIPSGLLQGAYNEGKELDLYADFPAEFIVKRDPDGNWCEYNSGTGNYDPLITGLSSEVFCMAEAPDGKIYVGGNFLNAGGNANADYLARWNPVTELWESVVAGINGWVLDMAFDANGDLYIVGNFTNLGSADGDYIVKITDLDGTPTVNALGTGTNNTCNSIIIDSNGYVYAGGGFTLAGGVAGTSHIAKWNGTTWSALSTGLNSIVRSFAFAPNGDLYIGGGFDDPSYPYLCKWNGTAFSAVGTAGDIGATILSLCFDKQWRLYAGGVFTNAGGVPNADYIARWSGSKWEALGTGTNGWVYRMTVDSGKVYVSGLFTTAGGLTLTDRIAIWSNGAWQPLDINLPGSDKICYSVLPASDGSLYIGGAFSTTAASENAETGIVALNLNVTSASANTYPFVQVTGPGTLKSITNYSTGKTIAFDGLTLQAGEWIGLSFDPLNLKFRGGWAGRGNLMRYVIPGSDYGDFYLSPGANYLSVFMTDTDSNSGATIAWSPKFWGLDGSLL